MIYMWPFDWFFAPVNASGILKYKVIIAVLILLIILVIWFNETIREEIMRFISHDDVSAICVINPTIECPNVRGIVKFKENGKKGTVTITFDLSGLTPGEHGAHIHKYGNTLPDYTCHPPDVTGTCCMNAGPHYNPTNKSHGSLDTGHIGDFGNILADEKGNVYEVMESTTLKLVGAHSIIGRALIIHKNKDDLGHGNNSESKKTGNSGPRVACGVVAHAAAGNTKFCETRGANVVNS